MPRFSVTFGRRKSTADNFENVPPTTESSFRVLERSEVGGDKSLDGGAQLATKQHGGPKRNGSDVTVEDNIFANLKSNRGSGSGSSNTTKTISTDTSSRHSNVSTAPSSAEIGMEEWRYSQRKMATDIPVPPIPKSSSTGFLKNAGRTFSFGGQKKQQPHLPSAKEEELSFSRNTEPIQAPQYGRSRATTTSTTATVTAPRVDGDFDLDLGGDFSKILLATNDKRASVVTVKDEQDRRPNLASRPLTGPRMTQPSPIHIDKSVRVEAPPHSWSSHHSNEQLLGSSSQSVSPPIKDDTPPPVPPIPLHVSPGVGKHLKPSASPGATLQRPLPPTHRTNQENGEEDDEEARLLRDSLSTVTKFVTGKASAAAPGSPSSSRYRRNGDNSREDDDSLFDTSHSYSLRATTSGFQKSSPHNHKVMTPAEFELYRKDKERQSKERQLDTLSSRNKVDEDDDNDNYEEDDDDLEKVKQQAKQRRKQEAHMAVYRQQMMKVTGESMNVLPSRPSLSISFSTPNLPNLGPTPSPEANTADNSDEDEEVPLAILAAHGFPNKQRPPTRLSTMMSNPNLRASQQPSYQRPVSAVADASGSGARLPAFARNLPQDPFLGAGLVRSSVRESFALGGGSSLVGQPGGSVPPGGLVGVIANEERSRALRRGSPQIDSQNPVPGAVGYDPVAGIPSHMMYRPNATPSPLTPGDQAQIQMTQQMQQFMQMQMQFMQMMSGQNANATPGSNGHMSAQSLGSFGAMAGMHGGRSQPPMLGVAGIGGPEIFRHSFVGNDSVQDFPSSRGDAQMRTMSMVQPSSASWVQLPKPGFAPSIRAQGGGYAPSIAPSERSNIGLPGRYRPVSHIPPPNPVGQGHLRKASTMSGALKPNVVATKLASASDDDDDEEGWEAMKAKREKKKSLWKTKKSIGDELGAFLR